MNRFVQGADRQQPTLLPECLDDYVAEENPVRKTVCPLSRGGSPYTAL